MVQPVFVCLLPSVQVWLVGAGGLDGLREVWPGSPQVVELADMSWWYRLVDWVFGLLFRWHRN